MEKVLKSQFGLEALILHDGMNHTLSQFLPNYDHAPPEYSLHTACYLVTSPDSQTNDAHLLRSHQGLFAAKDDAISYRQVIDPSSWILTHSQRLQFGKTMRVLALRPSFHLTELAPLVTPTVTCSTLKDICTCVKSDCHNAKEISNEEKLKKLNEFLALKDHGQYHLISSRGYMYPNLLFRALKAVLAPTHVPGRFQYRVAKQPSVHGVKAYVEYGRGQNDQIGSSSDHCDHQKKS
jgi:hypothetical protein